MGFYGQSFGTEAIGETFSILVSNITVNIDTLPADQKMDPGAFVPINDNYDSDQSVPDDQLPVPGIDDPQLVDASVQLGGPSRASVKWHLDFPSSVNVYEVDGSTLTPLESGSDSSPLTLSYSPTTIALKIEGLTADDNALLQAVLTPIAGQINAKAANDQVKAAVDTLQINAYTVSVDQTDPTNPKNVAGAELDLKKAATGAFVPINNDDDAYSITSDGNLIPDMKVADHGLPVAIPGEDDLLPIVIHVGPNAPANLNLKIPGYVRVWQNADRSGQIKTGAALTLPAGGGDLKLYVEALNNAPAAAQSRMISLVNGATNKAVSTLQVTSFNWTGPLNVPQFGKYVYSQTTQAVKGTWIDPVDGTGTGAGQRNVTIQWGTGGQVGAAVYQATPDFVWGLEANIVKVQVTTPQNAFTPGNVVDGGINNNAVRTPGFTGNIRNKMVLSGGPGLSWKADVELTGASHGVADPHPNRGIDFVKIGFVQNVSIPDFRGTYGSGNLILAAGAVEGGTFWDTINRGTPNPRTGKVQFDNNGLDNGDYTDKRYDLRPPAMFNDANSQTGVVSQRIASQDTPAGGPPTLSSPYTNIGAGLLGTKLMWNFALFVSATTTGTVVNTKHKAKADDIYVPQAEADWTFNGTGSITDPNNALLPWQGNGARVDAPSAWRDATSETHMVVGPNGTDRINTYIQSWWRLGWGQAQPD